MKTIYNVYIFNFCFIIITSNSTPSSSQVYKEISDRPEHSITVRISYLEIYNETMFDLLSTLPSNIMALPTMTVVEDEYGVSVKGLSMHVAANEEEALNLLFEVTFKKCEIFGKIIWCNFIRIVQITFIVIHFPLWICKKQK